MPSMGSAPERNFIINGGTIDNTSGSPMVLSVGLAGYTLGGDLNFPGSSSMDFGPATVTLTGTRTINVGANMLTLGPVTAAWDCQSRRGHAGNLWRKHVYRPGNRHKNGTTLALPNAARLPDH